MQKIGFDSKRYLEEQTKEILKRVKLFNNKLYLEFGGKLGYDAHAARVLPGYDPQVKLKMLQQLKDKIEIILCIYAGDIVQGKMRGDFGITYDHATLKLIDDLRKWGINKITIVITRFNNEPVAIKFKNKLEKTGIKIYTHKKIKGYPKEINFVVSQNGFDKNKYIPTKRPIVVVTGPGPNSGKLATCLSQLYHDHQKGIESGYAKFETFPIWNLVLNHPVNIAYEAATADIHDYNLLDPFHYKNYKIEAVNYNRDVGAFPILKAILKKIVGQNKNLLYNSPTDMGVNQAGFAIINNRVVRGAACQELIRRYFRYTCEFKKGIVGQEVVDRIKELLDKANVKIKNREVVKLARQTGKKAFEKDIGYEGISCGAALELQNGKIITAHNSELLHAASAVIIKASKELGGISKKTHLIPEDIIKQMSKERGLVNEDISTSLDLGKTLTVLSVLSVEDSIVDKALNKLKELHGCEMHMTHMPTPGDERALKNCGINLTCDAHFSSNLLFEM